jgi:hypothetical protein
MKIRTYVNGMSIPAAAVVCWFSLGCPDGGGNGDDPGAGIGGALDAKLEVSQEATPDGVQITADPKGSVATSGFRTDPPPYDITYFELPPGSDPVQVGDTFSVAEGGTAVLILPNNGLSYRCELVAYDVTGASDVDQVDFVVNPAGLDFPPVLSYTTQRMDPRPGVVAWSVDCSASTDDSAIQDYSLLLPDGTVVGPQANPLLGPVEFPANSGTQTVTVTARDDAGQSSSATAALDTTVAAANVGPTLDCFKEA